ncbi:MAG: hypothetical protein C0594_04590 [Marinilabiliales bacterium]|nr:MAG: hypothetical protein C0594_04590 [Marinilabiliales bacterium]
MQNIKLILPAYNEEKSLARLLSKVEKIKELFGFPLKVIVVNDGSTDDTLSVA